MDLTTRDFKQFASSLPKSLLLLTFLLPVAGFALGYLVEFSTVPENTRLFLSALVGAQAGVLAIVFSVTVIGIQLIATRYSPRMISLFTDSPIFIYTFALFVFSIAVDLALLFSVPASSLRLHRAGVVGASGLGVTAAVALFVFVRTAIRQSTPDGAIDAFISGMTTEKYLSQVKQSVENDSETAHPMHPLYNLTMNALSGSERVTAEKALQEYGDLVQDTLADLENQDVFSQEDRKVVKELFEPVFKEHLHDIALHAEEKEENQIVGDAVEWQYKLGKDGLDLSNDKVASQAQFGLSDVLRDAPVETGTLISSNNAWDQLGQLLVDASEKPKPGIVWTIASSIETGVSRQLWKVSDVRWYEYSMTDLYRRMKSSQEALLKHYGEDVAQVDMQWQYEHVPDDAPNREEVRAVFKWRNTLLDTTEHFLRYLEKEGRLPITEGNFKDSWRDICIEASESPAEDYAVTLCQALIEIAMIDRYLLDENGIPWSSSIGRVKHKGNPEVVEKAFEQILEYDYEEKEPGPVFAGEMEEHRKKYYQNQLNLQDLPPLNTIPEFEQIIREIQQDADERLETLQD
jgi:hypothetical protein